MRIATPSSAPQTPDPKPVSPWVWAFRCLRWSTYLAALITLILVLRKQPAPPVAVSAQAATRAEEKMEDVQRTVSQGKPATLRLDESELNSYLANHLELQGSAAPQNAAPAPAPDLPDTPGAPSAEDIEKVRSSVKDVKVQMEGDQVRAFVVFDMHGKDMTLELVGKLGSADGYLKFEPVSGKLGSMPIPQSALAGAVQRMMESPENRDKLKLPPGISGMHIENGELVATYQ